MLLKKYIEFDPRADAGTILLLNKNYDGIHEPYNDCHTFQLEDNLNIILTFDKIDGSNYIADIELLDFSYMLPLKLLKLLPNDFFAYTKVDLEFIYDKINDKVILYLDDQSAIATNCIIVKKFPANSRIFLYTDNQSRLIKVEFQEPKLMLPDDITNFLLNGS